MGLILQCGKGILSQSQLSVQTLLWCLYKPLRARINICVHVEKKSQTMAATPLFGHPKILHTMARMGSAALVAAVALPRSGDPNFPRGIMK